VDAAGKAKALALPEGHGVTDVAPDGKSVVTRVITGDRNFERFANAIIPLDNRKPIQLKTAGLREPRFSPDGKRVLAVRSKLCKSKDPGLFVIDIATNKEERIKLPKEIAGGDLERACWSPSGQQILLHWQQKVPQPPPGKIPGGGAGDERFHAARVSAVAV